MWAVWMTSGDYRDKKFRDKPDGSLLVTPIGTLKGFITSEKLVIMDKERKVISAEGNEKPSSKMKMQMRCCYRMEALELFAEISPCCRAFGRCKTNRKIANR